MGGEEGIDELTVIELNLELYVGLLSALRDDFLVKDVQVMVTGVDHLRRGGLNVKGLLVEVSGLSNEGLGESSIIVASALEVTNWLGHEGEVAELHDRGLGGLGLDGLELLRKGLDADIVGLSVLHPVDGEQVTEARTDVCAIDSGLRAAVSAPRRLSSVGGGNSIDVLLVSKVGEHGAGLAGLEVESELLEHLIVRHGLDSGIELIGIDPVPGSLRGADKACTTMINEVDEDLGVLIGLEGGTV